ncbi:MAG: hypothetical protein DRQ10_01940 [Candidatus Hydrothermota bacterium]|nr:MAG: hypothetical protein DRQ10_01940 [Candidatus Hydrothermae bacterium]
MTAYLLSIQIFSLAISVGIGPTMVFDNKYKPGLDFRGGVTLKTLNPNTSLDFQFDVLFLSPTDRYFDFYENRDVVEKPGGVSIRSAGLSLLYTKRYGKLKFRRWHSEFAIGLTGLIYDLTATEMSKTPSEFWGLGLKFAFRRIRMDRRGGGYGYFVSAGLPIVRFEALYPISDQAGNWNQYQEFGGTRFIPQIALGILLTMRD